ncbi:hypothetical protein CEXT_589291 [Caerostris extrusa]|uniref:Uncharacterized protein n=1 Tax=Caerostris extrusa TaxID=172846 RepID=A0AAV4SNB5_CAEEX|nr:hypothetical protein CEXT_589291 [Caerostris extrusa]
MEGGVLIVSADRFRCPLTTEGGGKSSCQLRRSNVFSSLADDFMELLPSLGDDFTKLQRSLGNELMF